MHQNAVVTGLGKPGDASGAQHIQVVGFVERGVEGDDGGTVDDDVGFALKPKPRLLVDVQIVPGQVARDRDQFFIQEGGKIAAEPASEAVEATGLVEFPFQSHPGGHDRTAQVRSRTDEDVDAPDVRDRPEDFLDQTLSQEPGGSGNEQRLAREIFGYRVH